MTLIGTAQVHFFVQPHILLLKTKNNNLIYLFLSIKNYSLLKFHRFDLVRMFS